MRKIYPAILGLLLLAGAANSQVPHALVPNITIDPVISVNINASRMAIDPISGHLFYTTVFGDIYEVSGQAGAQATQQLSYTSADHSITFLQNILFKDSTMVLCGNQWQDSSAIGLVVKGILQPGGNRVWSTIAISEPYPTATPMADHGFSGLALDPNGDFLYLASGSRTAMGEIRDNGGDWPGVREVPLTTRMFRLPINGQNIILPNDSTALDNSGYTYAQGLRNSYDLAFDAQGRLFGAENSGERDDPEELNWIRQGHHYGFPWRIGGNWNPLLHSPYDAAQDPLVNPNSFGFQAGYFNDDPNYPQPPLGVSFTEPVRNFGPDADNFLDSLTGQVRDASNEGTYITSFSTHRSPLGLVFDNGNYMAAPYQGHAFMTSFMPGGDSTGYSPLSPWGGPCVPVDPCQDLLHLTLAYNAGIDNFDMNVERIVEGFYLPVDAAIDMNTIYVLEYRYGGTLGKIWRVTMPTWLDVEQPFESALSVRNFPNPTSGQTSFDIHLPQAGQATMSLYDLQGRMVSVLLNGEYPAGSQSFSADLGGLPAGIYYYVLQTGEGVVNGKVEKL